MSRLNKDRRKQLLRQFKQNQVAAAHTSLPIANAEFKGLFDTLDVRLPIYGCDRTRRITVAYLREHALPEEHVLRWSDDNGGFCDCEVLANSEERWKACKDYQPQR